MCLTKILHFTVFETEEQSETSKNIARKGRKLKVRQKTINTRTISWGQLVQCNILLYDSLFNKREISSFETISGSRNGT